MCMSPSVSATACRTGCHRVSPHGTPCVSSRGSRVGRMLGTTQTEVCSWHHQAIDRLGDGLRPVAWAEDGVIEAVEHTEHPWCIGVQWHPEMQRDEAPQRGLFAALVAATGRKR